MRNKFGLSNFENTHTYTHTYSNYSTENICYTFSITIIMTYLPTNHQTFSTWKVIKCLNEAVQILLVQNQQKNHSGKVENIIKSTLCSIPKVDFILILQINLFLWNESGGNLKVVLLILLKRWVYLKGTSHEILDLRGLEWKWCKALKIKLKIVELLL